MNKELKGSGVAWLGKIPKDWNVCRVKNKYRFHKIVAKEKCDDYERIALTLNGVIKRDKEDANGLQPENYYGYQIVYKDDLIFKLIDLENVNTSRIGKSAYEGIVSPAYIILTGSEKTDYGKYFFLNMWYQEIFNNLGGDGVRSAINKDDLLRVPYINISIEEQERIVNYLDDKCSKIDKAIEDNKKQIELIEEYKKTIINHTLKPKENWRAYRIKNIAKLKGRIGWQGLNTNDYISQGAYLITGTDFNGESINWDTCVHISKERFDEAPEIHIKEKDLLITKDGTIGKVAIIGADCPEEVSLNSGVLLIRPLKENIYDNRYIYYLLKSDYFWDWYNSNQKGNATIRHLYQEQFANFKFSMPIIEEQIKIATNLHEEITKLDKVIEYRNSIISRLEEYKKSLIYELVTGKKEV